MPDQGQNTRRCDKPVAGFTRRDVLIMGGVFLLAFAIRCVYVLQLRASPYFDHETMDAGYHDAWARAIASGQTFIKGPYFRAPLYAWLLAGLYKLTGTSYLAVRLIQAGLGSISCVLVYVIGRYNFSRAVCLAAAVVCSTYWVMVYFDAELLDPVVSVLLNLVLLWQLLRVGQKRTLARCALAGGLLGLCALARANILLFAPVAGLWILLRQPRWKQSIASAAVFAAGVLVVIAPVTIRNAVRGDDFVLIASSGGVNFYIGNHAGASGMTVDLPGVPSSIEGIYERSHALAEEQAGQKLTPSEASGHYLHKALTFMADQPTAAGRLMLRKLRYFWSHVEIPNNKHFAFLTDRFTPVIDYLPAGFWLIGPLGLAGLLAASNWRRELFVLKSFVVVYMISVVLFFVTSRFRLPVVPVLALLAAFAVERMVRAVQDRRWRRAVGLIACTAVGAVLVGLPVSQAARTRLEGKALADLARVMHAKGQSQQAIDYLTEALSVDPNNVDALYSLGVIHDDLGEAGQAESYYRKALKLDPRHVSALNNLGRLLVDDNRPDKAVALLQRARDLDPSHAGCRFNLGRAFEALGRYDEALAAYREGLSIDPDRVDIRVRMVNRLRSLQRYPEAVKLLATCLDREPDNIDMLIAYCQLRASVDDAQVLDGQAAVRAGRRAVELTGGDDPRALDALAAAFAEDEQWDRAIETADKACRLMQDAARRARDHQDTGGAEADARARAICDRGALYRAHQKFRVPVPNRR